MTSEQVERITDPATIRNIDWSDHYETTTPRGATPMFETDQDLSEREADANALEAYRNMVAKLEAENEALRADAGDNLTLAGHVGTWFARAEAAEARLEQAEARVDQLTDQLRERSEALNRTGESNDQLRATIERLRKGDESGCATCGLLDDFRAGMGES